MESQYSNHQVYSAADKLLVRCINNIAAVYTQCPDGLEEADESITRILEFYTENAKYRAELENKLKQI